MTLSHEQAKDLIADRACGQVSDGTHRELDNHLATCDECAGWNKDLDSVIHDLAAFRPEVPQALNEAVASMLQRGLPEDPWSILWEAANEIADPNPAILGRFPRWTRQRARREAAELSAPEHVPTAKDLVREQSLRVEETYGRDDSRGYLAEVRPGEWVGVLTTSEWVPLSGVNVCWRDTDGKDHECITDLRGSFRMAEKCQTPQRVIVGQPFGAEFGILHS